MTTSTNVILELVNGKRTKRLHNRLGDHAGIAIRGGLCVRFRLQYDGPLLRRRLLAGLDRLGHRSAN